MDETISYSDDRCSHFTLSKHENGEINCNMHSKTRSRSGFCAFCTQLCTFIRYLFRFSNSHLNESIMFTPDIQSYWCCHQFCPMIVYRMRLHLFYFRSNRHIRQCERNQVVNDCRNRAKCFQTTQCRLKLIFHFVWQPIRFPGRHRMHWNNRRGRRRNGERCLSNGDRLLRMRHRWQFFVPHDWVASTIVQRHWLAYRRQRGRHHLPVESARFDVATQSVQCDLENGREKCLSVVNGLGVNIRQNLPDASMGSGMTINPTLLSSVVSLNCSWT